MRPCQHGLSLASVSLDRRTMTGMDKLRKSTPTPMPRLGKRLSEDLLSAVAGLRRAPHRGAVDARMRRANLQLYALAYFLLPKTELLYDPFRGNVLSSDWDDNGLEMDD